MLLLQDGDGARLVRDGEKDVPLPPDVFFRELAADGSVAVGVREERVGYRSRVKEVVAYDFRDRSQTSAYRPPLDSSVGDLALSPSKDRIAFVQAKGGVEGTETMCVAAVGLPTAATGQCFPAVGRVLDLAWAPDGERVVATGTDEDAVRIVNADSGQVTVLIPPGGNRSIRTGLAERGLGPPVQLGQPLWSPSGALIAFHTSVVPGGAIPVVVDASTGRLVALGHVNGDAQRMAWAPGSDLLAYTTGIATEGRQTVRILSPTPGADDQLATLNSQITGLAWSPSGASVAVALPLLHEVRALHRDGTEERLVRLASQFGEPLTGWSREPGS